MSLLKKLHRASVRFKASFRYIRIRLKNLASSVWSWIAREIFIGAWKSRRAKKKIKNDIRNKREVDSIEKYTEIATKISDKRIDYHEKLLRDRRRSIRDKAENNVLGVTTAVSILSAGSILVSGSSQEIHSVYLHHLIPVSLFLVSLTYFLFGGRYAFDAMSIGTVHRVSPENKDTYSRKEFAARRLWCLNMNKKEILLRTNALDVSFTSIRNGVFFLILAILSTLPIIL